MFGERAVIIKILKAGIFIFLFCLFFQPFSTNPEQTANQQENFYPPSPHHFKVGEELLYTINWGVVPAGSAVLRIDSLKKCAEVECYKVTTSTKTNTFFDKIYKVRDTVESFIEVSLKRSHYYQKKQQEGNYRRNDELLFDYKKEEVTFKRESKVNKVLKIKEADNLFDPFSVLYYVRSLDLKVGDIHETSLTDGKSIYLMEIHVLGKERVKTWIGTLDCLKIEPRMQNIEGIFFKKEKAKLWIWLTNDDRKIPVKVESEILIGSFQGILREIRNF